MIVIADSNIIISAIYNPQGTIAKILVSESKIQFYAPEYLLEEVQEHLPEIERGTGKSKHLILKKLKALTAKITIIELEAVSSKHYYDAIEIVRDIDIDDMPFVALYFHTGHRIWTGDKVLIKGLKKKGYNICITTSELKQSLYKK